MRSIRSGSDAKDRNLIRDIFVGEKQDGSSVVDSTKLGFLVNTGKFYKY